MQGLYSDDSLSTFPSSGTNDIIWKGRFSYLGVRVILGYLCMFLNYLI